MEFDTAGESSTSPDGEDDAPTRQKKKPPTATSLKELAKSKKEHVNVVFIGHVGESGEFCFVWPILA